MTNRIANLLPQKSVDDLLAEIPADYESLVLKICNNNPREILEKIIKDSESGMNWRLKHDPDSDAALIYRDNYVLAKILKESLYGKE